MGAVFSMMNCRVFSALFIVPAPLMIVFRSFDGVKLYRSVLFSKSIFPPWFSGGAASGLWQGFEDHASGGAELVGGDGMAHAGVDAFSDGRVHFLKEGGGFMDSGDGDMGIGVACSD